MDRRFILSAAAVAAVMAAPRARAQALSPQDTPTGLPIPQLPLFKAGISQPQTQQPYDRSRPLYANDVWFDSTGCYDPGSCCFIAPCNCYVQFNTFVLWQDIENGTNTSQLLFMGQLPRPGGDATGEVGGADNALLQPFQDYGAFYNLSNNVSTILRVPKGSPVWSVPCANGGGTILPGGATFFEGIIVGTWA